MNGNFVCVAKKEFEPELMKDIAGCTKTSLQEFKYDYPWEQVVLSYTQRFPKHPQLPVLISSQVIEDTLTNGVRVIKRRCQLDVEAPGWFKKAIGVSSIYFIQETTLSPGSMRIFNSNETFADKALFGDVCEYKSSGDVTLFEQYGFFQLPRFPLVKMAEKMMAKSYSQHTAAGRLIDIEFIKDFMSSGQFNKYQSMTKEDLIKVMPVERTEGQKVKAVKKLAIPEVIQEDLVEDGFYQLAGGSLLVATLPLFIAIKIPLLVSFMSVIGVYTLLYFHYQKYPQFWRNMIKQSANARSKSLDNLDLPLKLQATPEKEPSRQAKSALGYTSEDLDSSDPEQDVQMQVEAESDEDTDYEEEEDDDEDETAFTVFTQTQSQTDDSELGENVKLKDIQISVPAFIDKTIHQTGLYTFIIEVTFPNGVKRTVERLYTDFVRLKKYYAKTIPQCKVQLPPTYLPGSRKSDATALGMALDNRRQVLENYLKGILLDEAVAKLGHRVAILFCKHRGLLFPPSLNIKDSAKKRLFGSSSLSSSTLSPDGTQVAQSSAIPPSHIKSGLLLKVRWRTSLREIKVSLDKQSGLLNLYCDHAKDSHCSLSVDDIQSIQIREENNPLRIKDKYSFMEIIQTSGDHVYFCSSSKESLDEWIKEIKILKETKPEQKRLASPARTSMGSTVSKRSKKDLSNVNKKIILNQKKFMFKSEQVNPNALSESLLSTILSVYQEFTDDKCVLTARVQKRLQQFAEYVCELQCVHLDQLMSQSEQLSFYLNVYHTMVVHSHLDMGYGSVLQTAKKLRGVSRNICYDINNQIFSMQDIEHSVLRAPLARPVIINNTLFSYVQSPRFNKKDPRAKRALSKPDLRVNFVLNNGFKSSIYNIWIYSAQTDVLDAQLDHASAHFLNEQLSIDLQRRVIHMPRVCQYYSGDLGGSKSRILKTLLKFMSPQQQREVKNAIKTVKLKLRYNDYDYSIRGVFFKGHDQTDVCPLKPVEVSAPSPQLKTLPKAQI